MRKLKTHIGKVFSFLLVGAVLILGSCDKVENVVGPQDRTVVQKDTMKVYTVRLTGVELRPIERKNNGNGMAYGRSDTLSNQLSFETVPQYNIIDSTEIYKRSMEERLSYEVVNPVEHASANPSFKFNKPIVSNGRTINAGMNFLADSLLKSHVDFPKVIHPSGRAQIKMDKDHFFIPSKLYMVQATWHTTEGEAFTDSVKVFINIK